MLVFDFDGEPWQIKVKDQKAVIRFSNEIRIYDSETFSKILKVIPHSGDICIIDEYFISSRSEAFSIYDFNGNIIEYIAYPFSLICDDLTHGLNICNNKLMLTTSFNKILSIELS